MSPPSVYADWADEPPRKGRKSVPDHRKQSLYFSAKDLREMRAQAKRLGRSLSWVMQATWVIARGTLRSRECEAEFLRRLVANGSQAKAKP